MPQITVDKTCRNNQALSSTWSECVVGNTSASPNSAVTRQEKWKTDSGNAERGKIKGSAQGELQNPVTGLSSNMEQQIPES